MWAALIPMLMSMMSSQGGGQGQSGGGGFGGMFGGGGSSGGSGGIPGSPGSWGKLAGKYFGKTGQYIVDPIGSLLGGGNDYKNPADAAKPYLDQIQGTMTPYYQPYIDAGKQAMGSVMPQYQNLMNNPTSIMNAIGSQYKASPGFQNSVNQATMASNQAAAAGGMVGSPAQQQSLAGNISDMASKDYNSYLQTALGQYGMGLGGLSGINQMGYNASSGLADNLSQALMSQAQLAYEGQNNANQAGGGGSFLGGLL